MTVSVFKSEPDKSDESQKPKIQWRGKSEAEVQTRRAGCDSQRVGMAAPRPIKGILKNKNTGTNVKSQPEEAPQEKPEQAPGLSEEEQQWVWTLFTVLRRS